MLVRIAMVLVALVVLVLAGLYVLGSGWLGTHWGAGTVTPETIDGLVELIDAGIR